MATSEIYRWRKTTDINREHALFELLNGEVQLLDVGFTNEEVFEVAFNASIGGKVMELEVLLRLLAQGKVLAESDR